MALQKKQLSLMEPIIAPKLYIGLDNFRTHEQGVIAVSFILATVGRSPLAPLHRRGEPEFYSKSPFDEGGFRGIVYM